MSATKLEKSEGTKSVTHRWEGKRPSALIAGQNETTSRDKKPEMESPTSTCSKVTLNINDGQTILLNHRNLMAIGSNKQENTNPNFKFAHSFTTGPVTQPFSLIQSGNETEQVQTPCLEHLEFTVNFQKNDLQSTKKASFQQNVRRHTTQEADAASSSMTEREGEAILGLESTGQLNAFIKENSDLSKSKSHQSIILCNAMVSNINQKIKEKEVLEAKYKACQRKCDELEKAFALKSKELKGTVISQSNQSTSNNEKLANAKRQLQDLTQRYTVETPRLDHKLQQATELLSNNQIRLKKLEYRQLCLRNEIEQVQDDHEKQCQITHVQHEMERLPLLKEVEALNTHLNLLKNKQVTLLTGLTQNHDQVQMLKEDLAGTQNSKVEEVVHIEDIQQQIDRAIEHNSEVSIIYRLMKQGAPQAIIYDQIIKERQFAMVSGLIRELQQHMLSINSGTTENSMVNSDNMDELQFLLNEGKIDLFTSIDVLCGFAKQRLDIHLNQHQIKQKVESLKANFQKETIDKIYAFLQKLEGKINDGNARVQVLTARIQQQIEPQIYALEETRIQIQMPNLSKNAAQIEEAQARVQAAKSRLNNQFESQESRVDPGCSILEAKLPLESELKEVEVQLDGLRKEIESQQAIKSQLMHQRKLNEISQEAKSAQLKNQIHEIESKMKNWASVSVTQLQTEATELQQQLTKAQNERLQAQQLLLQHCDSIQHAQSAAVQANQVIENELIFGDTQSSRIHNIQHKSQNLMRGKILSPSSKKKGQLVNHKNVAVVPYHKEEEQFEVSRRSRNKNVSSLKQKTSIPVPHQELSSYDLHAMNSEILEVKRDSTVSDPSRIKDVKEKQKQLVMSSETQSQLPSMIVNSQLVTNRSKIPTQILENDRIIYSGNQLKTRTHHNSGHNQNSLCNYRSGKSQGQTVPATMLNSQYPSAFQSNSNSNRNYQDGKEELTMSMLNTRQQNYNNFGQSLKANGNQSAQNITISLTKLAQTHTGIAGSNQLQYGNRFQGHPDIVSYEEENPNEISYQKHTVSSKLKLTAAGRRRDTSQGKKSNTRMNSSNSRAVCSKKEQLQQEPKQISNTSNSRKQSNRCMNRSDINIDLDSSTLNPNLKNTSKNNTKSSASCLRMNDSKQQIEVNQSTHSLNLKRLSHATNLAKILSKQALYMKARQSANQPQSKNPNHSRAELKDMQVAFELSQERSVTRNRKNPQFKKALMQYRSASAFAVHPKDPRRQSIEYPPQGDRSFRQEDVMTTQGTHELLESRIQSSTYFSHNFQKKAKNAAIQRSKSINPFNPKKTWQEQLRGSTTDLAKMKVQGQWKKSKIHSPLTASRKQFLNPRPQMKHNQSMIYSHHQNTTDIQLHKQESNTTVGQISPYSSSVIKQTKNSIPLQSSLINSQYFTSIEDQPSNELTKEMQASSFDQMANCHTGEFDKRGLEETKEQFGSAQLNKRQYLAKDIVMTNEEPNIFNFEKKTMNLPQTHQIIESRPQKSERKTTKIELKRYNASIDSLETFEACIPKRQEKIMQFFQMIKPLVEGSKFTVLQTNKECKLELIPPNLAELRMTQEGISTGIEISQITKVDLPKETAETIKLYKQNQVANPLFILKIRMKEDRDLTLITSSYPQLKKWTIGVNAIVQNMKSLTKLSQMIIKQQ